MIRVEHLKKEFRSGVINKRVVKALEDVSFQIEEGKTLGIVGESGCGKSTLCRAVLKLIDVDEGNIFLMDVI